MDGICLPPLRGELLAWAAYLIIIISFTVVNVRCYVKTRRYHDAAEETHKMMNAILKAAAKRKRGVGA